ncbi:hypothetical protein BAUCODRAFT_20945 [Baudoinia panamericana UAMH 10762]|uniref:Xylanolytic transcriptional activator regulatory domain-containing protein n=1 Tax=Baudoinia panamericana (strain UAMH 10762) TaxID=717646 RepID=M2NNZ5_BAUPA|nr:uncharacterized protein BAUCODRAFT_20945 [Baudoinia panamericana UAMH 10762]EMD00961.1 hypothetical protein BAUCODRAFT_20945 [Baudoinia panamericana UAMH 10762]
MATTQSTTMLRPSGSVRGKTAVRNEGASNDASGAPQVAHTLQRKTRCDPGLPRCGPCERTNSTCEYWDSSKGHNVNRNYVVYLQHKVQELEEELDRVENEDAADDPETMMRAATVRMYDAAESKYLGPSSGIAITRLVIQLAKQFTDAKSIKDIVPEQRAKQIKQLFQAEHDKPTSKVYPLISDVAADDLPNKVLTDLLLQLYKLKVQPMYPALHEPTLDADVEFIYQHPNQATSYQNFIVRMVIAISLQKMDTQYAGLADSYYLAALKHLEAVVRPMDLKTLQCFALMAEYSLLTPTRTAIYYILGIAVRLLQALGYHEERTITRGKDNGKADYLEIDMRRRLFWCIIVMDCGLAHSLGRPAMLATNHDHIDVGWFETCHDSFIKPEGIDPAAPRPTLKKWVAIHFFKMRMLQLEIRRKLYLRKRPEPVDDTDPWFIYMDAKLCAWRDAAPSNDEGIGLDKVWFIGRYNTMIVFMYRPSPQVPRPSLAAALKCFDACQYNIYMQREQIQNKNVDLTWIFTQSIFMAINCMLWTLSYVEVRRKHSKASVEKHLETAMDAIQLASARWPGVASAVQLYHNLINAIMKIYEKDGDVPISAATPSEMASPSQGFPDAFNRSQTTSPATVSSTSVTTPPIDKAPFGYFNHTATRHRSVEQPPPVPYQSDPSPSQMGQAPAATPPPALPAMAPPGSMMMPQMQQLSQMQQISQQNMVPQPLPFDPNSYANPFPDFTADLSIQPWTAAQPNQMPFAASSSAPMQSMYQGPYADPVFDPNSQTYPFPGMADPSLNEQWNNLGTYWDIDTGGIGNGLNMDQQHELLHNLETSGMEDIQSMITQTLSSLTPKQTYHPHFV